jgi:hypothetical protein
MRQARMGLSDYMLSCFKLSCFERAAASLGTET